MSRRGWAVILLLGIGVYLFVAVEATAADAERRRALEIGLRPGVILDATTAQLARGYMPPETLAHYEKNEFRNEIIDWPLGRGSLGREFAAQTERNARTLDVNEAGTVIDKATAKQPPYVYAIPFPGIDPSDPRARANR